MERGDSCSLIPFVKQSRIVSRDQPDAPSSDFLNCNFWDLLGQQSNSSHWMEGHNVAPPVLSVHCTLWKKQRQCLPGEFQTHQGMAQSSPAFQQQGQRSSMASGCVVQRPGEAKVEPFSWQMVSSAQKLPSPKELYQKKRLKRKKQENARALSVCYHLEELKKRQSRIDELKKVKWGGSVAQPFSEEQQGADDDLLLNATDHKDPPSFFSRPRQAELYEKDSGFNRSGAMQFLYPEWSSGVQERPGLYPEDSLFSSYARAAQDGDDPAMGCLPEEDFLGFQIQLEE